MLPLATHTHDFEGEPLVTLTYNGRPAWVARHIGARLGYSHGGKRLPNKVLGAWNAEFAEGEDYAFLTGDELAAFKAVAGDAVSANAHRSLLILFESGLHMVLLKTRRPVGQRLRRFLVDEVMPQLARTGEYRREPAQPRATVIVLTVPRSSPSLAERRERRLARQAATREKWVDVCDRRLKVAALHRSIDRCQGSAVLPDDVAATLELTAAEIALGTHLTLLRRDPEGWVSPATLAERWGVSTDDVDKVVDSLGLQGDPMFSRPGADGVSSAYLYNAAAEHIIEEAMATLGQCPRDAA